MDAPSSNPSLDTLPKDMLVQIVAKSSTDSTKDHSNVKLACKQLLDAAEDPFVYKHVSTNSIPVVPNGTHFTEQQQRFLDRCKLNGNKDIAWRQGIIEFLNSTTQEDGCDKLRDATYEGKVEAMYVYSMILLNDANKSNQEKGVQLFEAVKQRNSIEEIRDSVGDVIQKLSLKHKPDPALNPVNSLCNDRICKRITRTIMYKHRYFAVPDTPRDYIYNVGICLRCAASWEQYIFVKTINEYRGEGDKFEEVEVEGDML